MLVCSIFQEKSTGVRDVPCCVGPRGGLQGGLDSRDVYLGFSWLWDEAGLGRYLEIQDSFLSWELREGRESSPCPREQN